MRHSLLKQIQQYLTELQNWSQPEAQWQIVQLQLRKKLISRQGLSVERLDNLQIIFLYYCTHIFKTGKHMTFQRLQYEKSHLTMDRFFLFLKDFSLTTAPLQGKTRQILQKNDLVLLFKRVSINCKDLNFEQFINCLQKIAILHYDTKVSFLKRQEQLSKQRKKRKDIYLKKMKKRKEALEMAKIRRNTDGDRKGQEEDKVTEHNEEPEAEHQIPAQEAVNIEPQVEVPQTGEPVAIEQLQPSLEINIQTQVKKDKPIPPEPKPHLLPLTQQQKIQFLYQLINVDNTATFKRKMRELNLPLFQGQQRRAPSQMLKKTDHFAIPTIKQSLLAPHSDQDEQKRLSQLRSIIQQRKQREKALSPHMSKQDYDKRRKKRQQDEDSPLKKDPEFRKRKIELGQLETDLRTLSKIPLDQINFRRGNPLKLFESAASDPYLEEYYTAKTSIHRSEKQIMTGIQANSQLVLDRLKKRAIQVEAKEKNYDSQMSGSKIANTSNEHRQRKNRLVEQLLERTKNLK